LTAVSFNICSAAASDCQAIYNKNTCNTNNNNDTNGSAIILSSRRGRNDDNRTSACTSAGGAAQRRPTRRLIFQRNVVVAYLITLLPAWVCTYSKNKNKYQRYYYLRGSLCCVATAVIQMTLCIPLVRLQTTPNEEYITLLMFVQRQRRRDSLQRRGSEQQQTPTEYPTVRGTAPPRRGYARGCPRGSLLIVTEIELNLQVTL